MLPLKGWELVLPNLVPDSDQSLGSWTDQAAGTTNVYTTIDDDPIVTAEYAESESDPSSSQYVVRLSNPSGTVNTTAPITIQVVHQGTGAESQTLTVELIENISTPVVIASETYPDISSDLVTSSITLSSSEKLAVTDWDDLYIRFTADTNIVTSFYPADILLLEGGTSVQDEDLDDIALERADPSLSSEYTP